MVLEDTDPASPVLAGPILRRVSRRRLVFWLATNAPVDLALALYLDDNGQRADDGGAAEPGGGGADGA